jgi:hypothetical protein
MGGGEPREERIEGKVEVARVPFDELDEEHARPKERGE